MTPLAMTFVWADEPEPPQAAKRVQNVAASQVRREGRRMAELLSERGAAGERTSRGIIPALTDFFA
jgi:hypothetical protein